MKRKKELLVILSSLLVIVLSVSVAYFTTKILGTGKEISVESADLKVIFTSGSGTINGSDIEPGWSSAENTFTVKNESNGTYKYNIIIKDLVNTFVTEGFLQYKITSSDGGYNMTDFVDVPKSSTKADTILAENINIEKGTTHTYKIVINYNNSDEVDQSADMGKLLSGKIFIEESTFKGGTLSEAMMYYNPVISTRTDFSTPFTTNTANTLYKTTENGTDVYYFAGIDGTPAYCEVEGITGELYKFTDGYNTDLEGLEVVDEETCTTKSLCNLADIDNVLFDLTQAQCQELAENQLGYFDESIYSEDLTNRTWYTEIKLINNWVKFGKNSSNQDLYWRIIRTNADGSIRLLYAGTSPNTTEGYIGKSAFNTYETSSPKYVGYMYGNNDSTLDEARTNTNDSTIKTFVDTWYENNLASYTNYLSNDAVYCNDRELKSESSYSTSSSVIFKSTERLFTNKTPTYDCTNNKDAFSVNNAEAKLKYPIALMTADEIAYAGGVADTNAPMWYYTNSTYNSIIGTSWGLLSPRALNVFGPNIWYVDETSFDSNDANYICGVRPVISLNSCVQWKSGDGSASNPYEIVETSSGC